MELALWAVRGCLLLVFTRSVMGKVRSRAAFAEFTGTVRSLPPARPLSAPLPARTLAVLVVTAEAALVPALALPGVLAPPAVLVAGLGTAAVLLSAFTALAADAARRGSRVPCRCFGRTTTPLGAVHAVRNSVLLAVAVTGLVAVTVTGRSPEAGDPMAGDPMVVLTALLGGAVLGLLVTALDDLAALFRPLPRKESAP
ncbi:MauE/DoxX family redox-associated membrane protein [Streptomyces sp. NPDC052179]|uniref:MauE/DoxX family redox-associated membrane protein n=1 Tax=Streptomyces sp. NPDC052179 TaxID=3155680 RepID=UPI0034246F60